MISSRLVRLGASILLSIGMAVVMPSGAIGAARAVTPVAPPAVQVLQPASGANPVSAARPDCMPPGWNPALPFPGCHQQVGSTPRTITHRARTAATTGTRTISGKVTGIGGAAVGGINVEILAGYMDSVGSTVTAADGTYSVSGLDNGSYTVYFLDPNDVYLYGYYATGGVTVTYWLATPVSVATSDAANINIQLDPGYYIRGTVTGNGGLPLAGIEVSNTCIVGNEGPLYYCNGTTTAANGTYALHESTGTYSVSFWDNSGTYLSGYYDSGAAGQFTTDMSQATEVELTTSDIGGINVQMITGFVLSGTITGPGGAQVADESVVLRINGTIYFSSVVASSIGTYSIRVAAGTYSVCFVDSQGHYVNGCYNSSAAGHLTPHQGLATLVNVTADLSGLNVELGTGTFIHGTISGIAGPLPNAQVEVVSNDYMDYGVGTTASDGTYTIDVTPGVYFVYAYDFTGSYQAGYYSTTGTVSQEGSATRLTVGSTDLAGINLQLPLYPATYQAVAPSRILDTRSGLGISGALSSHHARGFQVTGYHPEADLYIPPGATAVTGNLTVTQQSAAGFLYLGPNAMDNPTSSTVNFPVGDDRANAVTVALANDGTLSVTYAAPSLGPTAQVILDVTGYFTPDSSGSTYHAVAPTRMLDSRDGTGGLRGAFGSHVARAFHVTGGSAIPTNAIAVTGNLTVTSQTSLGFLYVGPDQANNPTSSTLNFPKADDRANGVTVALGTGGVLWVTYAAPTLSATADVIFDVTGYFTPDTSGASFVPVAPKRLLDSRNGTGATIFSSHVAQGFQVRGTGVVPVEAVAVTGNVTVTQQARDGFVYVGPFSANDPTSSTLNFPVGDDRANAVDVAVNNNDRLYVTYAAPVTGPTAQVIFDVTGYFVP